MRTFATVVLCLTPLFLSAQTTQPLARLQQEERLFCDVCGKQNELRSAYCYYCGEVLDKASLASRLKSRAVAADSLGIPLTLTASEFSVLVNYEAEQKARAMLRKGVGIPSRPKTATEKAFDVILPVIVGTFAVFLVRESFFK